jgi:membrane protease YdiL (CAAX protease family)
VTASLEGVQRISRRAAAVELTLFLSLVFSFIWLWAGAVPHASAIVYLTGLSLTVGTHLLHL